MSSYTQGQVITFIEKSFGGASLSNAGLNASVVCPRCVEKDPSLTKRKLVIRTDDFLTHCWVCGYKSTNIFNLLKKYRPYLLQEYREKFAPKYSSGYKKVSTNFDLLLLNKEAEEPETTVFCRLPEGYTLIANHRNQKNKMVDSAWKYLQGRGVGEADLWYWKLGVTAIKPKSRDELDYRFRVILPSFDSEGNLNFFSARLFWDKFKPNKYENPRLDREHLVFNELNIDWTQELTIVEGVFDLMKCNRNATCLLGSSFQKNYLLFHKIVQHQTPVLLALDPDVAHKSIQYASMLSSYGINVRLLNLPEEFGDVGKLTKEEFQFFREHAQVYREKDFLLYKLGEFK